jgi:Alr-MurF fusion protein
MYTLAHIAGIDGSALVGADRKINHFLNDSRNVQSPSDTLFFALKSSRNDGHIYIPALIEKGVRSFLVQKGFEIDIYTKQEVSFIVSEDPLRTLQALAVHHRGKFSIPVIGITGSNGKTVVKEWLYQLLKKDFTICRSPKSYNSQIGVPLSVLNLHQGHTLAIFEAGISKPGEMEALEQMIKPTLGVFTSIGSAHDEGFKDRRQKIHEKLKLFRQAEGVIVNGLSKEDIPAELRTKTVLVSENEGAELTVNYFQNKFELKSKSHNCLFEIPFTDRASFYNAATCATVLLKMGYKEDVIASGLQRLQSVALRLEIKNAINNSLIINDYYNSDLDSLKIALNYLKQQTRRAKKIVIVSDIEQSGMLAGELYRHLSELFSQNKIDMVVGIGKEISNHKPLFRANSLFFNDTRSFIEQFRAIDFHFSDATILLKGARSFGFENISRLFQLKSHDTVFEVNLNRLTDNVNYYRSLVSKNVHLMCMVKAMGYGSGSAEIARTLEHIGVNYLAVAYADEGVELRQSQVTLPVMVMSPEEDAFEDIVNYNLEPEIYNFRVLEAFVKKLDAMGIAEPYPIHIKIDTGMHRLGFEEHELEDLVAELKKLPQVEVRSVFSHLAATDNPDLDEFTFDQTRVFEKAFLIIEKELGYKVLKHICNSGGITRFKHAHYNMVRLGIGMYGVGVNEEEQKKLENVGVLKTKISQIKKVLPGQTVGYNRSGKVEKETMIATIPIGYADGFSRLLGNRKHGVYIHGKFCSTIGNICMDMCMIDITGINCKEGDEVIIFENAEQINRMAAAMQTIPYEVLTNVSGRVKRVYIQE